MTRISAQKTTRGRQEVILSEMLKQGYINQAQYDEAVTQELVFTNASREKKKSDDNYSWFVDQVINDVVNDLCDKTGYEYDIVCRWSRPAAIRSIPPINPDVQAAVDQVYEDLSKEALPATASSQQLQSGIVIVDNTTGDIVALAGGVGKSRAASSGTLCDKSLLSPGSIIKPVAVYARHRAWPHHAATVMDDTPYSFTDTATWPKNLDSTYRGLVSVEEGCRAVDQYRPGQARGADDAGIQLFLRQGQDGTVTLVSSYKTTNGEELSDVNLWALALGSLTRGVTVRAMTAAYAAFANEGVWREGPDLHRCEGFERTGHSGQHAGIPVAMKDATAWYITDMLKSTVERAPARLAQLGKHDRCRQDRHDLARFRPLVRGLYAVLYRRRLVRLQ